MNSISYVSCSYLGVLSSGGTGFLLGVSLGFKVKRDVVFTGDLQEKDHIPPEGQHLRPRLERGTLSPLRTTVWTVRRFERGVKESSWNRPYWSHTYSVALTSLPRHPNNHSHLDPLSSNDTQEGRSGLLLCLSSVCSLRRPLLNVTV